jgi:hypothetical protein
MQKMKKLLVFIIVLLFLPVNAFANALPQRPFPQRGFDNGLMVELFTSNASNNQTTPGTPREMDMQILHQFARLVDNQTNTRPVPASRAVLFNPTVNAPAGWAGTRSVYVVDPATWEDPDGFRMIIALDAGTGGTAHTFTSYRMTVCESMGYGMLMLVMLAGSEDINLGSAFGNRTMRQVLLDGLPLPLRNHFTANVNNTNPNLRVVSFQTYYDAMFRSLRFWPTHPVHNTSRHHQSGANVFDNTYRGGSPPDNFSRSYQMAWSIHHVWDGPSRTEEQRRNRQLPTGAAPGFFRRESGPSTATDGTMDMAYSLILAGEQWGHEPAWCPTERFDRNPEQRPDGSYIFTYHEWARRMVQEIFDVTVHRTGAVGNNSGATVNPGYFMKIGNWAGSNQAQGRLTRPSDHMMQHLKAYAAINPERNWQRVINTTYDSHRFVREATNLRGGRTGLMPNTGILNDFLRYDHVNSNPQPDGTGNIWIIPSQQGIDACPSTTLSAVCACGRFFHEFAFDGAMHWNACRVPWRLSVDLLFSGTRPNEDITTLAHNEFLRGATPPLTPSVFPAPPSAGSLNDSGNIRGRWLDGTATNAASGNAFNGVAILSAVYGSQAWFDSNWGRVSPMPGGFNMYGDYINILAMISASGNDWTPVGRSLTVNGGTTANGFSRVERVVAGAKVPLNAPALGFSEWTLSPGVEFWPGYDGTTRSTFIRMPANRDVIATVGRGEVVPAKATAFIYMFTRPATGETEWANGFNDSDSPQVEFDVTKHQDVRLTVQWPNGGTGALHATNRDIYLLLPTEDTEPNRLDVILRSVRVNGETVFGTMNTHAPAAGRWLVGSTIGTVYPVTFTPGFADSDASLAAAAEYGLELRTFYPAVNAFSIPPGATVDFNFRVGDGQPLWGDVDGNEVINSADVTFLRRYLAAVSKIDFYAAHQNFVRANADADGNNYITYDDLTWLRAHIGATNPATVPLGRR